MPSKMYEVVIDGVTESVVDVLTCEPCTCHEYDPPTPAPLACSVEVAPGGITGSTVVATIVGLDIVLIVRTLDG